jgi:hypothetical protein
VIRRHLHLSGPGHLLISTDIHGNQDDLAAVERLWRSLRTKDADTRWVILGDLVHGPDQRAAARDPDLYGWPDASAALVDKLWELLITYPQHVFFVIGNHDAAHIGGRITSKFHPDEAAHLESNLSEVQRNRWRAILCELSQLAISTSCGLLLTHGAPDLSMTSLDALDHIALPLSPHTPPAQQAMLEGLLYAYGQRPEVIDALLQRLSAQDARLRDRPLKVVVHGHDRDPAGYFTEGHNQLCPVIFGAPRAERRCVVVDLDGYYGDVGALRDGEELLRLHGAADAGDDVI